METIHFYYYYYEEQGSEICLMAETRAIAEQQFIALLWHLRLSSTHNPSDWHPLAGCTEHHFPFSF